jgi:two-component system, cell cycle sensor histidine kinase and response regulator CckA
LHPDAREVVVVSDVTVTGMHNLELLRPIRDDFRERVSFRDLVGLPRAEMRRELSGVRAGDVVLYLSYFLTADDENFSIPESMRFISENCPAPVYALWDFTMGHGAAGGKLVSSEAQGTTAARLTLQVLSGVSPDILPVVMESPNRYTFDHRQLKRFGISPADLPEGSRLEHVVVSPVVRFLPWAVGALGVIALQSMLIAALLIHRARRRKAEEDLRNANRDLRRLATAIDQAAEMILVIDPEGRIQYVNPAFERVTGFAAAEVEGRPPSFLEEREREDGNAAGWPEIWETVSRGEVWSGRIPGRHRDGKTIQEEAVVSPVRDGEGNLVNFVAVVRDITAEIRMEAQLRQSQKMEAVGRLAGGVAHDFNNLLQVMSGYAEMAASDLDAGHPAHRQLAEVLKAAARARNLVRQLLVFSRREASRPRSLNLNEVVRGMMEMIGRILGEHIELEFRADPQTPTVHADPHLMEQVLMNLCVNARDAMDEGGRLCIRTRTAIPDEADMPPAARSRPGRFAVLTVSDTGCGIGDDVRDRIFEPFFSTKEVGKGTGLGLATVYGIVEQHEGFIRVSSPADRGTRFDIFLPENRAGTPARPAPVELAPIRRGEGETILLAEDDEMVRDLTVRILERAHYRVLAARDGDEAVERFREHADDIALAILDVIMPRRSGRAVHDEIRRIRPDLPILFASGYSDNILEKGGIRPESFEMLPKPFRGEELLGRIARMLRRPPAP